VLKYLRTHPHRLQLATTQNTKALLLAHRTLLSNITDVAGLLMLPDVTLILTNVTYILAVIFNSKYALEQLPGRNKAVGLRQRTSLSLLV
jgi:hypothetical protein